MKVEKAQKRAATLPLGLESFVKTFRGYEILEEIITLDGIEHLLYIPDKYKALIQNGNSYKITVKEYRGILAVYSLKRHVPRMVISDTYLANDELRVFIDDKLVYSYDGHKPGKSALRELKQIYKHAPNSFLGWGVAKSEKLARLEVIAGFIKQVRLNFLHVENIIDPDKLEKRFKEFDLLKSKFINSF